MGLYNFKEKYYNYLGQDISTLGTVSFGSAIGSPGGTGTRENPYRMRGLYYANKIEMYLALGAGVYLGTWQNGYESSGWRLYGDGMGKTILKDFILLSSYTTGNVREFKDMTLDGVTMPGFSGYITNCEILKVITKSGSTMQLTVANCLIRFNNYAGTNNSYVGVADMTIYNAQLNLLDTCDVIITASDINSYKNNYLAFNNCRLMIGGETGYAALTGDTENDLRQNFVDRCAAQGITVPTITEYGDVNLPAGRWVFSNNSAVDGLVLKGSTIYAFEQSRLIYFGYTSVRGDSIAITTDTTKPGAFNPNGANADLDVTNGSIAFKPNVDISQPNTGMSDTNIIWLGGKKQLNLLSLIHNFPMQYGVMVDGSPTLGALPNAIDDIVPYENGQSRTYLVRSTDDNAAQVVYNGVTYSSILANYNNIFRGVSGQTSFTPSPNAAVYEILDEVMHQTIQMRIVNKIPADIITTGDLQAGYWYLVEPNSPSDTTGTVTYNGVTYPAYSSFLVASGTLGFTLTGATHLRRCWRQYYDDPANETTDLAFWANEQKPKWFDVLPDDLRCLMKHNNGLENEMQTDGEGNYITSGHPDFYNSILGISGILEPAYPVKGTYMQLRLVITTLNPM